MTETMTDTASAPLIRVVVADDHSIVREGLVALLTALPGVDVVGTAQDGRDAILTVAAQQPDVVVMDIQMPRLDGLEATKQITARHPSVAVLMLTMNEDDDTIITALKAGARGYLLKGAGAAEVHRSIQTAASGGVVFGAALNTRIVGLLAARPPQAASPFPELTDREREVLEALARGSSNAQMARDMYLSEKTIRNLVSTVYSKLGVHDRAQAIITARDAGLGVD